MNDYYKNLPKKRMGAGALIFNEKGELLIVKPNYKDGWSIPGGTINENESPRTACLREAKEEVGLSLKEIRFLCVDYVLPDKPEKAESLQFVFYGGKLNKEEIESISLQKSELDEYRFVEVSVAEQLLGKHLSKRLSKCIQAIETRSPVYLENNEL